MNGDDYRTNCQAPTLPHLYHALVECGHRDGGPLMRGTAAAIWHAIDTLQAQGRGTEEIRILEQVSVQVHLLANELKRPCENGDIAPRQRIAALTGEWLSVAHLSA